MLAMVLARLLPLLTYNLCLAFIDLYVLNTIGYP